jgi:hypothetical protein
LALATACRDADAPDVDAAIGTYELVTIGGSALPQVFADGITIRGSTFVLRGDQTFAQAYDESLPGGRRVLIGVDGTWSRIASDSVRLTASSLGGVTKDVTVDGTTLTVGTWVYERGSAP